MKGLEEFVRVLHLISSADRRGAQVFAFQLVGALGDSSEHLLTAISPATTQNPLPVEVLGSSRRDPRGVQKLLRILRQCDGVVAHGSDALLHATVVGALTHRPFIYRNIGDPSAWGNVRLAQLRIGTPLRRAAAVAALFPNAREFLLARYSLRPERLASIPNAVPLIDPPNATQRKVARESFHLTNDLTWVAFVGSLSEEKGVLHAIRAIAQNPNLGLVVAGSGPQEQLAVSTGANLAPGRVKFAGVIDHPFNLMAAVDALVVPSRTEGIPAVAIEAGLSRLPVVAANVGGMSEVIKDGSTGILVDDLAPASLSAAIDQALADRIELGSEARRHCEEKFSMDSVAEQWRELISDHLR